MFSKIWSIFYTVCFESFKNYWIGKSSWRMNIRGGLNFNILQSFTMSEICANYFVQKLFISRSHRKIILFQISIARKSICKEATGKSSRLLKTEVVKKYTTFSWDCSKFTVTHLTITKYTLHWTIHYSPRKCHKFEEKWLKFFLHQS